MDAITKLFFPCRLFRCVWERGSTLDNNDINTTRIIPISFAALNRFQNAREKCACCERDIKSSITIGKDLMGKQKKV